MELPKSIRIGHLDYQIEVLPELKEEIDGQTRDLYGQIWHKALKIEVAGDQPPIRQLATVMHEALHGIANDAAFDLDEKQVLGIETALMTLIRDNPGFIHAILDCYYPKVSQTIYTGSAINTEAFERL